MYCTLNSFILLAKFAFGFRENDKFLKIMYKCSRIFVKLLDILHKLSTGSILHERKFRESMLIQLASCEKVFQFQLFSFVDATKN